MSVSMSVSPYILQQYRHRRMVQPLRGELPSEAEQIRRVQSARTRMTKSLLEPIPVAVEKPKPPRIARAKPVENLDWPEQHEPAPYDHFELPPTTDWDRRVRAILRQFGSNAIEMRGECRQRQVVQMRRVIATALREEFGWSFPHIGRYMNRDHSSIISLMGRRKRQAQPGEARLQR